MYLHTLPSYQRRVPFAQFPSFADPTHCPFGKIYPPKPPSLLRLRGPGNCMQCLSPWGTSRSCSRQTLGAFGNRTPAVHLRGSRSYIHALHRACERFGLFVRCCYRGFNFLELLPELCLSWRLFNFNARRPRSALAQPFRKGEGTGAGVIPERLLLFLLL